MAVRVGLTGGIGSGKSTVGALFRERGIVVIDADQIAREVTKPGSDGLERIVAQFGVRILLPDGSLDRRSLGAIVFDDPVRRSWLESLLHPMIRERMDATADTCEDQWCVLEIPLLVESGRYRDMVQNVVVHCPVAIRRQRLQESRGMSEADVERIVANQASDEERLAIADHVIDNSGELDALPGQIDQLIPLINRSIRAQ